ncbi:MAG: hypothetical protein ABEK42_01680, partial [Thiohalorhabdaceae bacterium]
PVYSLSNSQYKGQERRENGYDVKGYKIVATKLQDQCEAEDRVHYPVHIESDKYHEEGPATLIDWFQDSLLAHGVIRAEDMALFQLRDEPDEVVELISDFYHRENGSPRGEAGREF